MGFNFTGAIHDSFSEVTVQGTEAVGGLTGFHSGTAGVESSYALGSATGETAFGGLVGRNYGSVSSSYWNESAYDGEPPTNNAGEQVTTEALKLPSTFDEWNFDTIWHAYPGKEPFLQWMDPITEVEVNSDRTQLTLRDPIAQLNVQAHHQSGAAYGVTQTARYEVTDGHEVVEVDSNGEVTAKTAGEAVVTIHASGVEKTVHFAVQAVTIVDVAQQPLIVVDHGTERNELQLPEQVAVTLSNGETVDVDVTWDNGSPAYNGQQAGTYTFKVELGLIPQWLNPDSLAVQIEVTVQARVEQPGPIIGPPGPPSPGPGSLGGNTPDGDSPGGWRFV